MKKDTNRLERTFEGSEALGELLVASGCELTVDEVIAEFECALDEGTQASEIIPRLWELEPKFESPAAARRVFSNLFGLWDRVADEATADLLSLPVQDPSGPLEARYLDGAWARLDTLKDKEMARARDRFDNVQSDVPTFIFEQTTALSAIAQEVATDLAFEAWWLCEFARGAERVPTATRAALLAAHVEPDDSEPEPEPALAALATIALWEHAADEEHPLPEEDIPAVERVLRSVRRVLSVVGAAR